MVVLRSAVFNLAFYVNVVVLMILGLPLVAYGRRGVLLMAKTWALTSLWWLDVICGLRVEFRGLENIPQGGYIVAAKHQSFLETIAIVPHTPDFAIILKRSLMRIPVFGLYLSRGGQIGINRAEGRAAMAEIIERAGEVLRAGRQVYIYPEGTRRPPGAPPDYKPGVALLYEAAKVPVLPVALNTGLFWSRNGFTRRPGVAVIEFLPVIPAGLPRSAFYARLRHEIEAASDRLLAEGLDRQRARP